MANKHPFTAHIEARLAAENNRLWTELRRRLNEAEHERDYWRDQAVAHAAILALQQEVTAP